MTITYNTNFFTARLGTAFEPETRPGVRKPISYGTLASVLTFSKFLASQDYEFTSHHGSWYISGKGEFCDSVLLKVIETVNEFGYLHEPLQFEITRLSIEADYLGYDYNTMTENVIEWLKRDNGRIKAIEATPLVTRIGGETATFQLEMREGVGKRYSEQGVTSILTVRGSEAAT